MVSSTSDKSKAWSVPASRCRHSRSVVLLASLRLDRLAQDESFEDGWNPKWQPGGFSKCHYLKLAKVRSPTMEQVTPNRHALRLSLVGLPVEDPLCNKRKVQRVKECFRSFAQSKSKASTVSINANKIKKALQCQCHCQRDNQISNRLCVLWLWRWIWIMQD